MAKSARKRRSTPLLVVVSGLSGAGISTCLSALEDSGFNCIDNLPFELLESTVQLIREGKLGGGACALGMDIRSKRFSKEFPALKAKLKEMLPVDVVFVTADEAILATRFGATRRRHALLDEAEDLRAAIIAERKLLEPVEAAADVVFDTSVWSPHFLARTIEKRYENDMPHRQLYLTITSFGFKHGQYRPSEALFDVRFITNPYFVTELRDKTGLDEAVREYIFRDPAACEFFAKMDDMMRFLLPRYYQEGKHYLRLGIGCTGGKHRSVCFAEELGRSLKERPVAEVVVHVVHRDLGSEAPDPDAVD